MAGVALPLTVARDHATLRAAIDAATQRALAAGEGVTPRVAFVPTMGALHAGHAALVREARATHDVVVASVFVNPAQFDDPGDLAKYPRNEAGDLETLADAGCDIAFVPTVPVLYPDGFASWIEPAGPALPLEGAHRPGHFRGVATVVTRLLQLVRPHTALFGEKDWQQLAVVRRVAEDLLFGVTITGVPTVRDADGLALSSRNVRLSADARRAALAIPRALAAVQAAWGAGTREAGALAAALGAVLAAEPALTVEYAEVVDAATLEPPADARRPLRALVAARVGGVRLIDNAAPDGPPIAV